MLQILQYLFGALIFRDFIRVLKAVPYLITLTYAKYPYALIVYKVAYSVGKECILIIDVKNDDLCIP